MSYEDKIDPKILNFLDKDDFFIFNFNPNLVGFDCKIIYDPTKADDIFSYTLNDDEIGLYQEWDIVRSDQIIAMDAKYGKDTSRYDMGIFKFLERKLDSKNAIYEDILEDIPYLLDSIFGDFSKIIFNDYLKLNNVFFENILQVYLAGGWPCGWEGEYPEGRLVVFSNE